ncbi:MAG TPA: hypothetical protein VFB07_01485 [Vicinamibacterales bacterium]|nr:hypothetical protein [Vicinamibacterales bacterium]
MTAVGALVLAAAVVVSAPVDFSGTWTLDTYLSDNSEQVAAAIRADLRIGSDTSTFLMTGARGPRERGRNPHQADAKPPNADEQKQIDDLTMALRYPAPTLKITQSGDAVTLTDAQGQTRTLDHWEGPQLVATTDLGNGRRMTATYSLVPTTKQLMVRTVIERAPNQPGAFEIKQVYDRAQP